MAEFVYKNYAPFVCAFACVRVCALHINILCAFVRVNMTLWLHMCPYFCRRRFTLKSFIVSYAAAAIKATIFIQSAGDAEIIKNFPYSYLRHSVAPSQTDFYHFFSYVTGGILEAAPCVVMDASPLGVNAGETVGLERLYVVLQEVF